MKYIIYSNDKNVTNAYVYDPSKHVKKGEKITQVFHFGEFEYPTITFRNKNKLSRSNGCLTTIDRSNINLRDPDSYLIELPNIISSNSKFVLGFRGEDGKYFGLKIAFKKNQSFDSKTSKVIYNGELIMQVTCQDNEWVKMHSPIDLLKSVSENEYYLGEYVSNKKGSLLNYLASSNSPKI